MKFKKKNYTFYVHRSIKGNRLHYEKLRNIMKLYKLKEIK